MLLFGNMEMTHLGTKAILITAKTNFVIHFIVFFYSIFVLCRFIEWMGCCCCGGNMNLKEEMDDEYHLAPICRDTLFHHSVRTKTCEAIAKLPFAMSLYSGSLSLFPLSLCIRFYLFIYIYIYLASEMKD
jgi:hypothetical protein